MSRFIAWTIVPVIVVQIIASIWWNESRVADNTSIGTLQIAFTTLVLPIYLIAIRFWKFSSLNPIEASIVILIAVSLSAFMGFMNWANSVGSWSHPDSGTLAVVQFQVLVGSGIALFPELIRIIRRVFVK